MHAGGAASARSPCRSSCWVWRKRCELNWSQACWHEQASCGPLRTVWQELAEEFGSPILAAHLRDRADETWSLLREQLQRLGGPRRLPEADAAFVEVLRQRWIKRSSSSG